MSDFALGEDRVLVDTIGYDLASTTGTKIISNASGYTAWSELIAATSGDSSFMNVFIHKGTSSSLGVYRLDVGVGAAGSEVQILGRLLLSGKPSTQTSPIEISVPCDIPAGSRVSFRFETNTSSIRELTVSGCVWGSQFSTCPSLNNNVSYGFNGVDGVDVDSGAIANTKGAWAELDPSISDSVSSFYLCVGDSNNTSQSSASILFDVSIGSAGNEVIVAENVPFNSVSTETMKQPVLINSGISKGDRVAVRCQSTINDVNDRIFSASITGFR